MSDRAVAVLMGRRPGALQAAESLSQPVVLIDSGKRAPAGAVEHIKADPAAPPAFWKELSQKLKDSYDVKGVIPLSEWAVVPAAVLRQSLSLPGNSPDSARLCRDKLAMKEAARGAGLFCADFVSQDQGLDRDQLIERLGLPLVIKPRDQSGGRGAMVCREAADVPPRLEENQMAESFVDGEEMSIDALLQGGEAIFTNFTEYFEPGWSNIVPAELDAEQQTALRELARQVVGAVELTQGMIHLEFFLTDSGVVFGEIAARPPGGYIMELIRLAYGFDPWKALLEIETGGQPEVVVAPARAAASAIFHPGSGIVQRIRGVKSIQELAGLVRLKVSAREGERLDQRRGSGQEAGHVVMTGINRYEVATKLRLTRETLRIELEPEESAATVSTSGEAD